MNAADKIERARYDLILAQPFFGSLAMHLRVEAVADHAPLWRGNPATMATDGAALYYSAAYVSDLTHKQLVGVLVHEISHCARLHHTRRGNRDISDWNVACDLELNPDVIAAGFELPPGVLIDAAYAGMSAEQIFAARARQQSQQSRSGQSQAGAGQPAGQSGAPSGQPGQQPGQGAPGQQPGQAGQPGAPGQTGAAGQSPGTQPGQGGATGAPGGIDPAGCGGVIDAAPGDAVANDAAANDWQARVRQAVAVARSRGVGTLPGGVSGIVGAINRTTIDVADLLRRFADESSMKDFSWAKPARRHIAAGRYLPSANVPLRPSHMVALVDTSGSLDDSDLARFRGFLEPILDDGAADKLTVVYADTKVHRDESFEPGDAFVMNAEGRGGTDFAQPLAWVAENIPDATAIVYLTDCDVEQWGEEPTCPVLWIVTGQANIAERRAARAPFGESVILDQ